MCGGRLYRLCGDWDGARAALARCGGQSECWASALEAESTGDLVAAQKLYREALPSADDGGGRTTCETAYYQASRLTIPEVGGLHCLLEGRAGSGIT